MRRFAVILLAVGLVGCSQVCTIQKPAEAQMRQYDAAAITLSDFSAKIMAHYQSKGTPVPDDFDGRAFLTLLEQIYPDQSRVKSIQDAYRVSARPLDGGYSIMLCDPTGERKIMEDFSCHTRGVEVRSWESSSAVPCAYEEDWRRYCE
jgi:hypothetical protein